MTRIATSAILGALTLTHRLLAHPQPATNTPTIEVLHRFPNLTRAENLCVLGNDSLLVTLLTEPTLYLVDPRTTTTLAVHSFPSHTSLLGITRSSNSEVAVVAGNISAATLQPSPGSFAVYLLKLSHRHAPSIKASFPLPDASFLNGLTKVSKSQPYLLVADSSLGVVWRVNIATGAVDKAISDPLFTKAPGKPNPALNGIRVYGCYLYFSNSNTGVLGRVRITEEGLSAGEPAKVITRAVNGSTFDDFDVGRDGTLFVSSPTEFSVVGVQDGRARAIVNDRRINHPSSVQRGGRGRKEEKVLYITTDGYLPGYGETGGGQIVKVTLAKRYIDL